MKRIKRKQMNSGIRLWKHWREVSCYSLETSNRGMLKITIPVLFFFLFSESSPSGSDNSDDEEAAGPNASKYNWLCMLLLLYLWIKALSSEVFSRCIFFSFQSQNLAHCLLFSKDLRARMVLLMEYIGITGQTTPSPSKSKYENAILQTPKNFLFIKIHFWECSFITPPFFFEGQRVILISDFFVCQVPLC